jgi:hypothetical protein
MDGAGVSRVKGRIRAASVEFADTLLIDEQLQRLGGPARRPMAACLDVLEQAVPILRQILFRFHILTSPYRRPVSVAN